MVQQPSARILTFQATAALCSFTLCIVAGSYYTEHGAVAGCSLYYTWRETLAGQCRSQTSSISLNTEATYNNAVSLQGLTGNQSYVFRTYTYITVISLGSCSSRSYWSYSYGSCLLNGRSGCYFLLCLSFFISLFVSTLLALARTHCEHHAQGCAHQKNFLHTFF